MATLGRSLSRRLLGRVPAVASQAVLVGVVLVAGCTRVEPRTDGRATISEEVFIEAMVALRTSFALNDQGVLAPGASEAILQEHGLTREHLETFVEVHGTDVPFMADVWARVQLAVDSANGRGSELEADPDG